MSVRMRAHHLMEMQSSLRLLQDSSRGCIQRVIDTETGIEETIWTQFEANVKRLAENDLNHLTPLLHRACGYYTKGKGSWRAVEILLRHNAPLKLPESCRRPEYSSGILARAIPLTWAGLSKERTEDQIRIIQALIEKKADVNEPCSLDGEGSNWHVTALHICSLPRVVSMLLEAGANPNAEGKAIEKSKTSEVTGWTPLHLQHDPKIVGILLEAGANPSARNSKGYQPIHYASSLANLEALVAKGADIKAKTDSGQTILHAMALNSRPNKAQITEFAAILEKIKAPKPSE